MKGNAQMTNMSGSPGLNPGFNCGGIILLKALILAGAICAAPAIAAEPGVFPLVKDGKPEATIVTSAQPLPGARKAVDEFQYFVKLITGTNLPVKTDALPVDGPVVLIGESKALQKYGVDSGNLKYDNFLIRSGKDFLAIAGRDTKQAPGGNAFSAAYGTANGVYAFLEDYCGVRIFMPCENGIIAPKAATLSVPANLDVNFQKSMLVGLLPFRGAELPLRFRWRSLPGLRLKTFGGHSWEPAIPVAKYFAEHPEYFALVNGKRTDHPASSLCIGNPDVLRLKIEWCKEQLKDYDTLELGHPDSYGKGCPACECEKCLALGKTLGDRVYWFHRKVAEAVREWDPSKKLLFLAYGPTGAPSPDWKFPDNVIVELTSLNTLEDAAGVSWSKVHNQFSVYTYFWSAYFYGFGPANSIREITEAFAKYKRYGINICYYCTTPMTWGLIAPQLYLDYRLRMDYAADPQKVLADFYAGMYGPAANAMKDFFEFVDEAQNTPIQGTKKALAANRYLSQWPVAKADAALKLLDKAEAAAGNDAVIKGRIELCRVSMGYIRWNSLCFGLERKHRQSDAPEDLDKLSKAVAERESWIDGILKKQDEGYYTKTLGLVNPFPASYRKEGTLRDQVVFGKPMAGHGLKGGPFDMKALMDFLSAHPKMEGAGARAESAPAIDGILDEAVWAKAPKMSMLTNRGGKAAVPTEAQVAYGKDALYVALTAHEPAMDKMEKKPARMEDAYWEDSVEIFLGESGQDMQRFVHFIVSFTNCRQQGRFGFITDAADPASSAVDYTWKAPWESAVKVDPVKKQWVVEMAVPWRSMGFGEPKGGAQLQANFTRNRWTEKTDPRPFPKGGPDLFAWSPTFGGFNDASRFGTITLEP